MTAKPDRRTVIAGLGAVAGALSSRTSEAQPMNSSTELILYNGKITTLDRQKPEAEAVAVRDGRFVAVGTEREGMAAGRPSAQQKGLKGGRGIPGGIDSPTHNIRGGPEYKIEAGRG